MIYFINVYSDKKMNYPYLTENNSLIFFNDFNGQLDQIVINVIKKYKCIKFGAYFNQPIINLPEGIEEIYLGYNFDQSLDYLPKSIKKICINSITFNKPIDNLPENLEFLYLNAKFNQSIDFLPIGLKELKFACNSIFNHSFENLPSCIKKLEIPRLYNQSISSLPDSIEEIRIGVKVASNCEQMFIPEYTSLDGDEDYYFNFKISHFPAKLKRFFIFSDYGHQDYMRQKLGNKFIPVSESLYLK